MVPPLLGPLPTRSSRGEDGELDAALVTNLTAKSWSWLALDAEVFLILNRILIGYPAESPLHYPVETKRREFLGTPPDAPATES